MTEINNRWESRLAPERKAVYYLVSAGQQSVARSGAHNDKCKHPSEIQSNAA